MTFSSNEHFTNETSKWLNVFTKDLAENPEKVLSRVSDFPLEPKDIVRKALREGPETLDKKDTETAKLLFNFIEFYATGKCSKIEVEAKDAKWQV